jgi:multicomponent Na+:H+ antiporter subunit E
MSDSSRRLRFRFQARSVVFLAVVWVLLWGEASLLNLAVGLLLGWLITIVLWLAPIRYYGRLHPWRILVLAVVMLKDLATASLQLMKVAFGRRIDIRPGIIRVDLRSDSDLYQVILGELISIVPGTLVVETRRRPRALYLHVFDLPDEAAIERERGHALALERRLIEAIGSTKERAAVQS